jgi:CheY-like chemotaxis protein
MWPKRPGWQLVKQLHNIPTLAETPIIVMSATDCARRLQPAASAAAVGGIVAHFAKPITVSALLATIRQHLPLL